MRLNDLKLNIRIIDKKKIFEVFYVRFNTIIALLKFTKIIKIFNLIRLISNRFKYKLVK